MDIEIFWNFWKIGRVIEKSWNFEIEASVHRLRGLGTSQYGPGKIMELCRKNFVATLKLSAVIDALFLNDV